MKETKFFPTHYEKLLITPISVWTTIPGRSLYEARLHWCIHHHIFNRGEQHSTSSVSLRPCSEQLLSSRALDGASVTTCGTCMLYIQDIITLHRRGEIMIPSVLDQMDNIHFTGTIFNSNHLVLSFNYSPFLVKNTVCPFAHKPKTDTSFDWYFVHAGHDSTLPSHSRHKVWHFTYSVSSLSQGQHQQFQLKR